MTLAKTPEAKARRANAARIRDMIARADAAQSDMIMAELLDGRMVRALW